MQRRSFLRAGLVSTGVFLAGCLSDSETVLDPPDREHDVDPEALAYPAHSQELPEETLPSPLHDREVSTRAYVGDRETLLTFVFTRCPGPCPALTSTLAQAQTAAADAGFSEEVVFMPITFDPEYDTPEQVRAFSEDNGADPTATNWQFLRPQTKERAREVVDEQFGVAFETVPVEGSDHGDHGTDENEMDEEEMTFIHSNLLLLVNRDGYVERAYSPEPPRADVVIDDLEAVREGYQ